MLLWTLWTHHIQMAVMAVPKSSQLRHFLLACLLLVGTSWLVSQLACAFQAQRLSQCPHVSTGTNWVSSNSTNLKMELSCTNDQNVWIGYISYVYIYIYSNWKRADATFPTWRLSKEMSGSVLLGVQALRCCAMMNWYGLYSPEPLTMWTPARRPLSSQRLSTQHWTASHAQLQAFSLHQGGVNFSFWFPQNWDDENGFWQASTILLLHFIVENHRKSHWGGRFSILRPCSASQPAGFWCACTCLCRGQRGEREGVSGHWTPLHRVVLICFDGIPI